VPDLCSERAGVIFIEENGEGPGVRLQKQKRKRLRRLKKSLGHVRYLGHVRD
jgi:hypothetical protein